MSLGNPSGRQCASAGEVRSPNRPFACFGGCVWWLPPEHCPGDFPNSSEKWKDGVWMGLTPESNEVYIGTAEGVKVARSVRRTPEALRWINDEHLCV